MPRQSKLDFRLQKKAMRHPMPDISPRSATSRFFDLRRSCAKSKKSSTKRTAFPLPKYRHAEKIWARRRAGKNVNDPALCVMRIREIFQFCQQDIVKKKRVDQMRTCQEKRKNSAHFWKADDIPTSDLGRNFRQTIKKYQPSAASEDCRKNYHRTGQRAEFSATADSRILLSVVAINVFLQCVSEKFFSR